MRAAELVVTSHRGRDRSRREAAAALRAGTMSTSAMSTSAMGSSLDPRSPDPAARM
jgi:hypothetical protein